MTIEHWMTFGNFAAQDYFVYPAKNTYAGIIINGNMVAHAPDGLAAFLLEKTPGTPYLIDPVTHAFQHDPSAIKNSDGDVRKSIRTLSEKFGQPVSGIVGSRAMASRDLRSASVLRSFVERCLAFQRDSLSVAMEAAPANKYLAQSVDQCMPAQLIAPYFYLDEAYFPNWLDTNIEAARIAGEISNNEQVLAAVVVSQSVLLDQGLIEQVISAYATLPVAGYLVWIDELDEHSSGSVQLSALLRLASGLRAGGTKKVINLHGGYFSVLAGSELGNRAFTGVAHGPEYGEVRGVVPVGGGIPISRYYIPDLHKRVKYREAVEIFRSQGWLESVKEFHSNVCACDECVATLAGNADGFGKFGEANPVTVRRRNGFVRLDYPTTEAKEHCLKHYLQRKQIEYASASKKGATDLMADLRRGWKKYEAIVAPEEVSHLSIWDKVFSKK